MQKIGQIILEYRMVEKLAELVATHTHTHPTPTNSRLDILKLQKTKEEEKV